VIRLDARNARVVVGPREALRSRTIVLRDVNWLVPYEDSVECAVKVRSMRPPVMARVTPLPERAAHVDLLSAEEGIAPGQACVFYEPNGSRVFGGGFIVDADRLKAVA
jgi:tRNA-specific 2-thiouridylase